MSRARTLDALAALRRAGYEVYIDGDRVGVRPVNEGQWLLARFVIEHGEDVLEQLQDEAQVEAIRLRAMGAAHGSGGSER